MNGIRRCPPLCSLLMWRTTPTLRLTTRSPARSETTAATAVVHVFSSEAGLSALHFSSADVDRPPAQRGDLAITTDGDGVEHVDYHVRGQWFDSLSRYWREFAKAGPLTERRYDHPRATAQMWRQPEHGTLARRVRVPPGEKARIRFAITWNYPLGEIYWFDRAQPGDPGICRGAADLAQLLCNAMGRFARQRRRSLRKVGRARSCDLSLSRFPVRLLSPTRDHRRCVQHAWGIAQRDRHSARRRRALGLGGPAYRRGIVRGQLHPCMELPAGARVALSGARTDVARDGVYLQPAAEWRA